MELKKKISQLFIVKTPNNFERIKEFIDEGIGGFMIGIGGEIISAEQEKLEGDNIESLKEFVKKIKELEDIPLFLAIDGEGGHYFNRLRRISDYKSPRFYGLKYEKDGDLDFFEHEVKKFAEHMKDIGLNMNFAPLVDVAREGYGGYIAAQPKGIRRKDLTDSESISSRRSYSDKIDIVITLALKAMEVFHENKIICTLKHFPTYGILSVDENPHIVLIKSDLPKKEIIKETIPYKEAFKKGCWAIMKGHIITNLDPDYPSSLSIKTERFLREDLSFEGLVIVDELRMGAIRNNYALEDAAPMAMMVNDIILISDPDKFKNYRDAILKKAQTDTKLQKKIDESYDRVIKYKKIIGLLLA